MKPIKDIKERIEQLERASKRGCSVDKELETLKKHATALEKGVKCDEETVLKTAMKLLEAKKFTEVRALLWILEESYDTWS